MKSAGEELKAKRISLGLSTSQVAIKLKIQEKYIIALEENDSSVFDSKVIARGFLIKYCKYLNIDSEKLLPFWRRDFTVKKVLPKKQKSFLEKIKVTPVFFTIVIFVFVLAVFLGFGLVQYNSFKRPPSLTLKNIEDGQVTSEKELNISGVVEGSSELYLNNNVLVVDSDGGFFETVKLSSGQNKITIRALSPLGRETVKTLTIYGDFANEVAPTPLDVEPKLVVRSVGVDSVFIEVRSGDEEVFSGFLLENTEKSFSGEKLLFRTDAIENIELLYKGEEVDTSESEFGEFIKEF
jgi:transcriptional regulator with XRE-family HTH domain